MPIFAVLADKPNDELGAKLEELYAGQVYTLAPAQWFISADSIAQTVSERLGLPGGTYGRVMVIPITSAAAGWHAKTSWEWLNQKAAT
jgi:hypothetical protein